MQILSLVLTIIGAILGFVGGLLVNLPLGVAGMVLTIAGAYGQYYLGKPYIADFAEADWIQSGNEFEFSIPPSRHLRGRGIVAGVYMLKDGSYQAVGCEEVENEDGSFSIRANTRFRGRLVLR
jgi:hypothetical protein